MKYKLKTGKILKADAVVAKANGTLSCLYLPIVLVTSRGDSMKSSVSDTLMPSVPLVLHGPP